jgi:hypothetical protein
MDAHWELGVPSVLKVKVREDFVRLIVFFGTKDPTQRAHRHVAMFSMGIGGQGRTQPIKRCVPQHSQSETCRHAKLVVSRHHHEQQRTPHAFGVSS